MQFKLIVSIGKPELTEQIIRKAKKAGATGSTIITATGTGIKESKNFLGLELSIASEVILFLVEEGRVDKIKNAINDAGNFDEARTGILLVLPVEETMGLTLQMAKMAAENQQS